MFGRNRRFPFRGLALVAFGFLLASVLSGGGSAFAGVATGLGLILLLPLLLFKMLFVFFLFGMLLRFAGGGGGWRHHGWGHQHGHRGWGPHRHGHRRGPWSAPEDTDSSDWRSERDRREWEESLRQANEEVRQADNPFSRPPQGFEPPKPSEPSDGPEGSKD